MAQRLYDEDSVKNIANAIRAKNGSTETYNIDEMPVAIEKLNGASFETDSELSNNSENPVQNKVIKAALDKKQDIIQYSIMPEASVDLANKIVQYVGNTTTIYTQGLFYKCVNALTKYQWQKISVSNDMSKLDKPDTTSVSAKLVTYSLATGTGIKDVDISIGSGSTDNGVPTAKAVYTEVNKKITAPAIIKEGILGYNSVGQISIREVGDSGTSVEIDTDNIPNNTALKEYVATKNANKVDKVEGKVLSTNDFTNDYKAFLENTIPGEISRIDTKITEVESNVYSNYLNKVAKSQMKTIIGADSTNDDIPTAKAVYDYINSLDASEVSY